DLAYVHARGHAERIQHDVDGCAVREVRHVLDRNDGRDDALVAVASRHLPALELEALLELGALRFEPLRCLLELAVRFLVLEPYLEPLLARQLLQILRRDRRAGPELARPARGAFA